MPLWEALLHLVFYRELPIIGNPGEFKIETQANTQEVSTQAKPRTPGSWALAREQHIAFWQGLKAAEQSVLICDYDGTLAPFKADKMQAVPYPGVDKQLEKIASLTRTRLALVSGRPVRELIELVPFASRLELFGSHGREHRSATGEYELIPASERVVHALDDAAEDLGRAGYGQTLERKSASLAVHWRNLSPAEQAQLAQLAASIFERHLEQGELAALPFESGLELRANDHTKAHAVEIILASGAGSPGTLVSAFLGDDTTDEDAFRALGTRGLSLLVREQPRPSLAQFWIRPPQQLIGFLDDWIRHTS